MNMRLKIGWEGKRKQLGFVENPKNQFRFCSIN